MHELWQFQLLDYISAAIFGASSLFQFIKAKGRRKVLGLPTLALALFMLWKGLEQRPPILGWPWLMWMIFCGCLILGRQIVRYRRYLRWQAGSPE